MQQLLIFLNVELLDKPFQRLAWDQSEGKRERLLLYVFTKNANEDYILQL